ncbi:hypothetical protein KCP70_22460 [Salmonella enterica subsp. enterica]|nr:hypothetical protein KCP70_22460 [Salmonella enterica subsp. enterica]
MLPAFSSPRNMPMGKPTAAVAGCWSVRYFGVALLRRAGRPTDCAAGLFTVGKQ